MEAMLRSTSERRKRFAVTVSDYKGRHIIGKRHTDLADIRLA